MTRPDLRAGLNGGPETDIVPEADRERADRLARELDHTLRVIAILVDALGGEWVIPDAVWVMAEHREVVRTEAMNGTRLRTRGAGEPDPREVDKLAAELLRVHNATPGDGSVDAVARYVLQHYARMDGPP